MNTTNRVIARGSAPALRKLRMEFVFQILRDLPSNTHRHLHRFKNRLMLIIINSETVLSPNAGSRSLGPRVVMIARYGRSGGKNGLVSWTKKKKQLAYQLYPNIHNHWDLFIEGTRGGGVGSGLLAISQTFIM